jgi:hypothetical protein
MIPSRRAVGAACPNRSIEAASSKTMPFNSHIARSMSK